jgi:hypothetical protein
MAWRQIEVNTNIRELCSEKKQQGNAQLNIRGWKRAIIYGNAKTAL